MSPLQQSIDAALIDAPYDKNLWNKVFKIKSRGLYNYGNTYYPIKPLNIYDYGVGEQNKAYPITVRFVRATVTRADGQPDTSGNPPPLPWKDWPQEKRSIAVASLTDSDWLEFVKEMPVGGVLKPGDKVNAPGGIINPGRLEDDPNTPEDERLLRKDDGFFKWPGLPNTDFDRDGTPDSADPEPQNPNVPVASNEPPPPSNEPAPSEGEQAVEQVREDYDDFLEKPENAGFRDRLTAVEEKYRRATEMEDAAATDPDVGYEQQRLLDEADSEFRQLENEIGEAWWSSLSQYERQLFDGRKQAEINEMQEHMEKWSQGTYPGGVAESILDHSSRKGYEDPLEYLRDASNFDKSEANRYPPAPDEYYSDGTALWKNLKTGEYVIIDRKGKIRTYGFDEY